MLFDATAVLVASLTVATVGGPVALPENAGVSPTSTPYSAHAGYAFTTPDAHAVTSPAPHSLATLALATPTLASLGSGTPDLASLSSGPRHSSPSSRTSWICSADAFFSFSSFRRTSPLSVAQQEKLSHPCLLIQ